MGKPKLSAPAAYKYDVGISFRYADHDLAKSIQSKLGSGIRTFVFSSEQPRLGGTHGTTSFREVFRKECNLLVVLYRNGWGGKGATGVEEQAIQDSMMERGWRHLVFVKVDAAATVPAWLPDGHIWLDLNEYGTEQVVGAIKARLQELGTTLREETVRERAARLKQAEELREDLRRRKQAEASTAPVTETDSAFEAIDGLAKELTRDGLLTIEIGRDRNQIGVRTSAATVNLYAQLSVGGESFMHLYGYKALAPLPGRHEFLFDKPSTSVSGELRLDLTAELGWCWVGRVTGRPSDGYTAASLADLVLKVLADLHDQASSSPT
jgi:hypothetical protein